MRQIIFRGQQMQGAAHRRGAHHLALAQEARQGFPLELLEARPKADEGRPRLLGLETAQLRNDLGGGEPVAGQQQLAREQGAVQIPET